MRESYRLNKLPLLEAAGSKNSAFDILISLSYTGYTKYGELNFKAIEPEIKKLIVKLVKKFLS
jgi:hypothetical protein